MKTTTYLALSILTSGLLLSGCGSSSSSTETTDTSTVAATSGQLVDNYVANVDYTCADGTTGITDENGSFECETLPVEFHLGGLKLGQINQIPQDTQVFPQDLVGVARVDINNTEVLAMAQFLQSCDEDNNTQNGIQIKAEVKEAFKDHNESFNADDVDAYATDANITLISEDEAKTHLEETTTFVAHVNEHKQTSTQGSEKTEGEIPASIADTLLTPAAELTQDAKNTLAYMGNEERLAYDVYTELYNYHVEHGDGAIQQLTNIATKSEATHIATVELLVEKYIQDLSEFSNIDRNDTGFTMADADLNATQLPMGVYNIDAIQNLHDALIEKGQQSTQDALEVGCMVEVTDITDLTEDIATAQESNATDIVTAFEFLRDGSYSHYWSFDKALKDIGVEDGCCSLGDEYCHPEYPTNTQGADGSSGSCDNTDATQTQQGDGTINEDSGKNENPAGPQDGTGEQKGKNNK